jgi:hypothetical protein
MRARGILVLSLGCACAACLLPAVACATPSLLGVAWFKGDDASTGLLAQRSIEREWPALGDSGVSQPRLGERSPIAAMAMSAVVPGTGQLYAGQASGLGYAAVEVAGWVSWALFKHNGNRLRNDAVSLAGVPADSASAWSFQRWESSTGGDASQLRGLYTADREAYYDAIGGDARYSAGWNDGDAKARFEDLRRRSDRRFETARWTSAGLWVNHLVAAVQALRAVRFGNMNVDLPNHVELKARGGLHGGRPHLLVTLERRF